MRRPDAINFERLILLINPHSSNAGKVEKLAAALENAYPGKIVKKTIQKSDQENLSLLKSILRPGDILAPCGGDGTISGVVHCLLDPSMPPSLRRTPILPVGTGRMNDVARMLNGLYFRNPKYVLRHGRKLNIYPLDCVCTPLEAGGKPVTKTVIYSIGFGYSGTGSLILNDPGFRSKVRDRTAVTRPIEFLKEGWSHLKDADYFDITYKGKRRAVLDVSAFNGHIFGGYYRLPTRLSQREFYFAALDDKSTPGAAKTIAELITNRFSGGEIATSANFTIHSPVTAHLGGETFTPPVPCKVRLTLHKEPITMLATNPKA